MEQREKLIELITTADDEYVYSDDDKDGTGEIAYIADYLLANGVVVLPCKVGDAVYQVDLARVYESKITRMIYETDGVGFDSRAIGKRVFLTREEAERALKGGGA